MKCQDCNRPIEPCFAERIGSKVHTHEKSCCACSSRFRTAIKPDATQNQIKAALTALEQPRLAIKAAMLAALSSYNSAAAKLDDVELIRHDLISRLDADVKLSYHGPRRKAGPAPAKMSLLDLMKSAGLSKLDLGPLTEKQLKRLERLKVTV